MHNAVLAAIAALSALTAACGSKPAPATENPAPEPVSKDPAEPQVDPDPEPAYPIPAHLADAMASPDRPAEDRELDQHRDPAAVLGFFGIEPGMTVADLMAGRGWYTEILARAVGPTGAVYAQNNKFVVERFADKPMAERLARPGLENVKRWDRELENLELPAGQVDAVLMVLFYHDTYWQKTDRKKMLAEIYAALEPGGVFGVIDHHAAAGTGGTAVKTLHRIEAELVKKEILDAGFELAAESDLLRHPNDDRTLNVFDDKIRFETDRFIYKFVKPAAK
jgi:predicted methyltransferase